MNCSQEDCDAVIEKPSKWVMIKAHSEGWYFQKNGDAWCPKHRPDWASPLAPDEWARKRMKEIRKK